MRVRDIYSGLGVAWGGATHQARCADMAYADWTDRGWVDVRIWEVLAAGDVELPGVVPHKKQGALTWHMLTQRTVGAKLNASVGPKP